MQLICSNYFLRKLRNLDFFELDFGKSKLETDPNSQMRHFRKMDETILRYHTLYNRDINKFGKIGNKVFFYEDLKLDNNEYVIFNNEDIYAIQYDLSELNDIKSYILDILMKIDDYENKEKEYEEKNQVKLRENSTGSDMWIATDEKNRGKKYLIDQTLTREEYRKEMEKRLYGNKNN